jgi:hypothetical protein
LVKGYIITVRQEGSILRDLLCSKVTTVNDDILNY